MSAVKAPPTVEDLLRAKAAAWDFLAGYTERDAVPETPLGDFLDAAYAYAGDTTGVDLGRVDRQSPSLATGAQLVRRFFHVLPSDRPFYVVSIDLNHRDAEMERKAVLKELRDAYKDRGVARLTVLVLYDRTDEVPR